MVDSNLDDDLLDVPAPKSAPLKDPETGKFVSPKQPQPSAPTPPQPSMSGYVLARARRLGIPNPEQMEPATLEAWLVWADGRERPPEAPKVEEPEPAFDWGQDDDGNPFTEERLKKEAPIVHRVKEYADRKFAAAEKLAKKANDQIEAERAARAARSVKREVYKKLAAHPEVFGASPHEAAPGSVEAERVAAVMDRLARIGQENNRKTLDHLDEDVARAMALFVAPKAQPPRPKERETSPRTATGADLYRQAELARPSDRRNGDALTKRERLLKAEAERLRENGVPVAADFGEDDDDDLLPEQ